MNIQVFCGESQTGNKVQKANLEPTKASPPKIKDQTVLDLLFEFVYHNLPNMAIIPKEILHPFKTDLWNTSVVKQEGIPTKQRKYPMP